jgi:molybdenum cofactor biosynthesis enzyme MoaA
MKYNIPLKEFSDYFFENISVGYANQLQITSVCNAKCLFCSNDQNPFEIQRCSFRPLEEIEKVVWSTSEINGSIHLNDSLPGRISEGEAFLHPDFFKILRVIRNKFNNPINITTNGLMLTSDFVTQLKDFNPLEISISFPTIDNTHWKESFGGLNDEQYYIVINSFSHLASCGIRIFANVTPMPAWVGWDELEKTFEFLSQKVQHFTIYAPGYTKHSKIIDKLVYDKMELSLFLEKMSEKYLFTYSWHLDPRNALYVSYDLITNNIRLAYERGCKTFLWLTSVAAKERFEELLTKLSIGIPVSNTVITVKNNMYGGNIECAGLWMIQDVQDALDDYLSKNATPNQVFMPKGFLDKYGFDLCGDNVVDSFKKYSNLRIGLLN